MSDELNPTASVETPETQEIAAGMEPAGDVVASALPETGSEAGESPVAEVNAADVPETPAEQTEVVEDADSSAVEPLAVAAPAEEAVAEAASQESVPVAPASMDELVVGMEVLGKVKRIELFGAFVDIGVGKDGLLHISQLGQPDVRNVADVVQPGQTLTVYVMKVDKEQGRIALSVNKPVGIPWESLRQGMEVTGTVIKLETYGVFVDFGAERPGMVHVSELASGYVKSPADVIKVGDTVTAQIIKIDRRKKRIDLSVKALTEKEEFATRQEMRDEPQEELPTAMELALRRAMDGGVAHERSKRDRDRDERRSRKYDRDQDDIYERTLRNHRG